jgi:hypothetical protein
VMWMCGMYAWSLHPSPAMPASAMSLPSMAQQPVDHGGGWVTRTWCVCSGSVVRRISVGYLLSGTTMSACAEPRWRRPSSISSAGIRTGRESPSSRLPRLAYNMSDNLERFLANGTSSSLSLSEYVLACFYHSCTELLQCVNSSIFFILEL